MRKPDYCTVPRERLEDWLQLEVEGRRMLTATVVRFQEAADHALRNGDLEPLQMALDVSRGTRPTPDSLLQWRKGNETS